MKLTEKGFLRKAGEAYIPTFAIYNNSNADGNNRMGIDKVDLVRQKHLSSEEIVIAH